jgi:hypothetical protein
MSSGYASLIGFCTGMNAARGIVEYKGRGSIIFLLSQKEFYKRRVAISMKVKSRI